MPDRPDWSKYLPGSERHSLQDIGELAVRLWSPVTYDRRGEVIWMDQFDHGFSDWSVIEHDTGDEVSLVVDYPYGGGYAVKLLTAGAGDQLTEIHRHLAPPAVNKWGLEVAVFLPTEYKTLSLELRRIDGSHYYSAFAQFNNTTDKLQIWCEDAGLVDVATLPETVNTKGLYHLLKIVGDFETNKYVRLLFNQTEYDLSAYTLLDAEMEVGPLNDAYISYVGRDSQSDYCQIGQVIVTANEP